jgi:hypothetical protein
MDEFDETIIRKRGKKKLLKVTFEDGKSICYKSTTMTFMETLRRIGVEKLQDVYLEVAHIPLLSKSVYPQFKDYQKELVKGWYVMTQSDSEQKYRQLLVIKQNLNLDIKIEIGEDLEEELGCPLEVVLKALKNGIVDIENHEHRHIHLRDNGTSNYPKGWMFHTFHFTYEFSLSDYKKTWWLKGEKENAD